MLRLNDLFKSRGTGPPHISRMNTSEEKASRLKTLSHQEREIYHWLFEGYSESWTAETIGLEKGEAMKIFDDIHRKLGIRNSHEIIVFYAPIDLKIID